MSKVGNINFCYVCDLAFETGKQLMKHNLSDEHLNIVRKVYEDGVEDETTERMYHPDENIYILIPKTKPKDNTKAEAKTDTETKSESSGETMEGVDDPDEDDYILKPKDNTKTETGPKAEVPCVKKFKNYIRLQAHMKKHTIENKAITVDYDIKSSLNQRQLCSTKSNNNFIENFNEPADYILDEF